MSGSSSSTRHSSALLYQALVLLTILTVSWSDNPHEERRSQDLPESGSTPSRAPVTSVTSHFVYDRDAPQHHGSDNHLSSGNKHSSSARRLLENATASQRDVRPRIFIIDPGAKYRDYKPDKQYVDDSMYALEMRFPSLIRAGPYVTTDPEQADYFYVDAWEYASQYRNLTGLMEDVQALPHWRKRGGRDHIVTLVHDKGRCDSHERASLLNDVIVMQHFGKATAVNQHNPCMLYELQTQKCDMMFQMIKFEGSKLQDWPHQWPLTRCYRRGQDLLVPNTGSESPTSNRFLLGNFTDNQTTHFFFVGGINHTHLTNPRHPEIDAGYSFGVRQTAWRMFRNTPGFIIEQSLKNYWVEMHKSLFCLAPLGWGWGTRYKSAIARGCIPVIIQDGYKVEWEDELESVMFQVAVRMPLMYLHRMPEFIERYIREGRLAAFQRALSCVWRLFWWRRPEGRAFEMAMCTLKARMLNAKVSINVETCTLACGDGKAIDLRDPNLVEQGI